jgi:H/ACA ribonucleoprotein complex subunit 2
LPVLCEEKDVTYIYVPSKDDLGQAALTKRPTSVVLVSSKKDSSIKDSYDKVLTEVKEAWTHM